MQRAGLPEELERPIGGRQAEPGERTPRALEELQSGEPTVGGLDRVEDGPPLRRQACPGGEGQASIRALSLTCARHCRRTLLKMILTFNSLCGQSASAVPALPDNGRRGPASSQWSSGSCSLLSSVGSAGTSPVREQLDGLGTGLRGAGRGSGTGRRFVRIRIGAARCRRRQAPRSSTRPMVRWSTPGSMTSGAFATPGTSPSSSASAEISTVSIFGGDVTVGTVTAKAKASANSQRLGGGFRTARS